VIYNYDTPTGVRNSAGVRKGHVAAHFLLQTGCGCTFYPGGPWVDTPSGSIPTGTIRAGQEPGQACLFHTSASYKGIDISFPGRHNEVADL
jgi:hypothetical protein